MILTVKEPFGDYKRGDEIVEPETVAEILASDNRSHVIKSAKVVLNDY